MEPVASYVHVPRSRVGRVLCLCCCVKKPAAWEQSRLRASVFLGDNSGGLCIRLRRVSPSLVSNEQVCEDLWAGRALCPQSAGAWRGGLGQSALPLLPAPPGWNNLVAKLECTKAGADRSIALERRRSQVVATHSAHEHHPAVAGVVATARPEPGRGGRGGCWKNKDPRPKG